MTSTAVVSWPTGTSYGRDLRSILISCSHARIISSDVDVLSLSEQEGEENFDLSLISSLETDVIPCLGDDRVPDYLITQLAKVLQQGSQLLLHELDDEYPPTPSSPTKPNAKDSERMGSTALVRGVTRERFSYWCLDLLFLICSDTSKGTVCAPR